MSAESAARLAEVQTGNAEAATTQATMPPAEESVGSARAAVEEPEAETEATAQAGVVGGLDDRPPPSPEIEALCTRIFEVIRSKRPPDEETLVQAEPEQMAQAAGQELSGSVEGNTQGVQQSYDGMNQPPEGQPATQPQELETPPAAVEAPAPDASAAAPDGVPAENVSLDADVQANQARMDEAGMSSPAAQLVQEGPIAEARAAQGELSDMAAQDPAEVLAQQAEAIARAGSDMAALQAQAQQALASARAATVSNVGAQQNNMVGSEEQMRAQAAQQMQSIFQSAQTQVNALLEPLPRTAMARWDAGVAQHSTTFKTRLKKVEDWIKERHGGGWGVVVSVWDAITGLPDWVTEEYDAAEQQFGDSVCTLIRDISRDVNAVIATCEGLIENARKRIDELIASLPDSLQTWAQGEQARMGEQLNALQAQATQARDNINRDLASRASSAVQEVREQIHQLREAAGGLVGRIANAVNAFLENPAKFIFEGLLSLLGIPPASFWAVVDKIRTLIDQIADDPMPFANNLMAALGQGFQRFFDNIGTHLLQGLMNWLFSKLGEVGVTVPTDLSLKSVVTLFLQVMGISWERIRRLLARHIGEENVALIEKAWELVSTLIEKGPEGIFEMLKEQLNPQMILDAVMDAAISYITEAIITRVTARIIMMFNPAGAILQAVEAIYRVLKWVFENAAQIFSLVETIVNGAYDILNGNIGGMAEAVERALVRLLGPVIGFLADYAGLGGIPQKIKEVIEGLQNRVEGILDRVIGWLAERGRALLRAVGLGPEEEEDAQPADGVPRSIVEPDPAQVDASSPELVQAFADLRDGQVVYTASERDPQRVTSQLLTNHPDARLDEATGQLTLPPLEEDPLKAAHSVSQIAAELARQTGVSKITVARTEQGIRFDGAINPTVKGLATYTGAPSGLAPLIADIEGHALTQHPSEESLRAICREAATRHGATVVFNEIRRPPVKTEVHFELTATGEKFSTEIVLVYQDSVCPACGVVHGTLGSGGSFAGPGGVSAPHNVVSASVWDRVITATLNHFGVTVLDDWAKKLISVGTSTSGPAVTADTQCAACETIQGPWTLLQRMGSGGAIPVGNQFQHMSQAQAEQLTRDKIQQVVEQIGRLINLRPGTKDRPVTSQVYTEIVARGQIGAFLSKLEADAFTAAH